MELIRLTTAGSVDDGKSTLIGRLLTDCQQVYKDQMKAAKNKLADLLDGLEDERAQGITIDVAYRYFSTPKRKIIIADSPGHEQYTRNMVTAASTANITLILVDARKGMLPQSKRHLLISSLLGIPHICIVVNKMDLINYDENKFEKIRNDFREFSQKLNINDIHFMPVSALHGDMVVTRGKNMNWYDGPTLLSYLENLEIISDKNLIDFRFPIQHVLRPNQDQRCYCGSVVGGTIKIGDSIRILPAGTKAKVSRIYFGNKEKNYAFNSESISIELDRQVDAARGNMIVREKNLPKVSSQIEVNICWLDSKSLKKDNRYILKINNNVVNASVKQLHYRLNTDNLSQTKSKTLKLNEIGRITIQVTEPIIYDVYAKNRNTGSFILIDEESYNTVAAGTIISKGKLETKTIRQEKGAVIWFTGLSGSGKSTIAEALSKRLKKYEVNTEQLDGDVLRKVFNSDLGYTKEDRDTNLTRAGFLADMLSRNGILVIASFISPYSYQRENLRKQCNRFIEVFVDTPLEVCEKRDVKGLYKKARAGKIKNFTGISDSYEAPQRPNVKIKTEELSIDGACDKIIEYLVKRNILYHG